MPTKANKTPINASNKGVTSSSKTLKQTKTPQKPGHVATPAISLKANANGHSVLTATRRDAQGRFLPKKSK
ncbi:MAG TPA: hypothetical protein VKR83_01210 [Ktedonobacteraceae bacterium]|nr:hypothetical protein [Ktedonobacteraceae bacterium]